MGGLLGPPPISTSDADDTDGTGFCDGEGALAVAEGIDAGGLVVTFSLKIVCLPFDLNIPPPTPGLVAVRASLVS